MRKSLLTIILIFFCIITINAQTFVSTQPENKNVILEEFTGISCGFCPDGHVVAKGIVNGAPNDVAVINIHATSFANPQGAGTDFRTSAGTSINGYWNNTSAPMGTVSRNSAPVGRGSWASATQAVLAQLSPVNVALLASVDMNSNVLTVDVEVYYTGSQTVSSNKLSIAIVQNNVLGPQTNGAVYNPSAIDPVTGLYTHNHMLRHMMTGTWGTTISSINQGDFFSDQYTWSIPTNINGVAVDPTNLGVIAFVSEDNQNILSGTVEVTPQIIFANSFDAYCVSASANDAICGSNTDIEVTFRNYGNIPLTSLDIDYSINGGIIQN